MVCLAITLERIEGMHVPLAAQAASAGKAAEPAAGLMPAFTRTSAISRSSFSPGAPAGKKPLGGLLGRVLPGRSRSSNGRRLDRSTSIQSSVSDDMLAGEDPGDECESAVGRPQGSVYAGLTCTEQVAAAAAPVPVTEAQERACCCAVVCTFLTLAASRTIALWCRRRQPALWLPRGCRARV